VELLTELGLERIERLLVFNKIDLMDPGDVRRLGVTHPDAIFVSARDARSLATLLECIAVRLESRWEASSLARYEPEQHWGAEGEVPEA
jgi:GTPase